MNRRDFLKGGAALVGLSALEAACATIHPDFYPTKGQPHTITYTDKKTGKEITAYDLSGEWETNYITGGREVLIVTQKDNFYEGFKTIGNRHIGRGAKSLEGEVNGNVTKCRVVHSILGWRGGTSKITQDGNYFECPSAEGLMIYKRLK